MIGSVLPASVFLTCWSTRRSDNVQNRKLSVLLPHIHLAMSEPHHTEDDSKILLVFNSFLIWFLSEFCSDTRFEILLSGHISVKSCSEEG